MAEPITKDTAVRNLQRYLRRLSLEHPSILLVPIDGIFASRTQEALEEFQRMYQLPVTGTADKITWDLLFQEYERLQAEHDQRVFPDFFPKTPPRYETTPEETGFFIELLQWMLLELTTAYDTLSPPDRSGRMDEATSRSVAEFQKIHGLPQTGQVNRRTWNRLSEEYNRYAT